MTELKKVNYNTIDEKTRTMIMIGLALGMLVACLDGTIITTSLKTIASDLGGMELYSWVFTAFMLCETIMIPIAGKLSDQYGRKPLLIIGIIIFLVGSVLGGMSNSMVELIIFRAMQGIGGGMLVPVATATVADLYEPHRRGKIQGMLSAIFAIGIAIGPLIGGFLTDNISWHWCFYINVPIGIAMIILTMKKFPKVVNETKPVIDYLGMALLTVLLMMILLYFTWGGVEFQWLSLQSGLMIAATAVIMGLFIMVERKAKNPVLDLRVFKNNVFVCACIMMLIFGMALMGSMAYVSIFLQMVLHHTATEAGLLSIAAVAGMMLTSLSSGSLMSKTGTKPWLVAGPLIASVGLLLMSTLHAGSSTFDVLLYQFILGIGLGCVMTVLMVAVQNNAEESEMGMATSAVNVFRSIGSTVATALFAMFINIKIAQELALIPDVGGYPQSTAILDFLTEIFMIKGPIIGEKVIGAYGNSIGFAFLIGGIIVLLVAVVALFMKDKKSNPKKLSDDQNTKENEQL